ncbi:hydroxymethylglutaryl-CoA reductase [Alteromonas aestuariivivens]|uniref:hydroxymethylglutaryl-CoA reductase (NADPH) n=1 Tax=Alteromonas aestuariivivens TaxID=1938339 RepID=A0A3D8M368_9ALTE|nr:hydroxymethylglutaryl-CoA reductase [Alteromonas aestuariivivens]RDV24177.1 hydroxymethylglutaryl-CoA reductase [Alteromonas aestuariivivens]
MFVPKMLLRQLYTHGSLTKTPDGICFTLKNRLKDAVIREIQFVSLDGEIFSPDQILVQTGSESQIKASELNQRGPTPFALREEITLTLQIDAEVSPEKRNLEVCFVASPFGKLSFDVQDNVSESGSSTRHIPRDVHDDYQPEIIAERQRYFESFSQHTLDHVGRYSVDPGSLKGNIEHFIGVAQVPIGIAGPLHINGEHAQGEFVVPLATTEGTLVASYNRGMKLLNMSGGVTATVVDDAMQRAPVFVFENARGARDFVAWVNANIETIREQAESTSSVAKLTYIDNFLSNKFAFLRFNYRTGDAAGQNMVGRATFAACGWILDHYPGVQNFYLESNFATDKKASQINIMRTRGKRVTAEATIKREHLLNVMRVEPKQIDYHGRVAGVGSFLSGVNNTGLHSPNGITAMFIATGQDVANVSESSAGIMYSELTDEGDLYISLTIPSLIVATYGGGTGIGTQRECLEMLDCYGRGKVYKFAEIVGAVALAGEISLASAISSSDWVSSHEQYGRNR